MKNKIAIKWLFLSGLAILVLFSTLFGYYIISTQSVTDCMAYCVQNSDRGATVFSRIGDGRYVEDYAYFIAANGDSSKAQEVFVFKRKHFGPFAIDRYEFVMSSTQAVTSDNSENSFGSIQFFTRNDNGEKDTGTTLLFFGANQDSDIAKYEYTLTVKEGANTYTGNVVRNELVWFVKFFDLGNVDENTKKVITEVKFYTESGRLVSTY